MPTRTYTAVELDQIGVPFECYPENGYAEELHDELYDTSRWAHIHKFVFRAPDDGKAYRVYYWTGATEHQDQDLWNWQSSIKAVEVEEVSVTTTAWKPVKEES